MQHRRPCLVLMVFAVFAELLEEAAPEVYPDFEFLELTLLLLFIHLMKSEWGFFKLESAHPN